MKPKVRVCAARGCDEVLSWRVPKDTRLCPGCKAAGVRLQRGRPPGPSGRTCVRHDDAIDTLLEVLAGP